MCILTFLKPGALPDVDALANGAAANPHGHGYAIVTGTTITVGHGMDAIAMIAEFATVRTRHPGGPALFHSRYATHGLRVTDNCHPFLLGGDPRTVLAHNGILPATVHPAIGDDRSDTRIAAEDYLPTQPFGSLDSWAGRERLERWLGSDKLVLLTVDPAYKHSAYLFNEQHGIWDGGAWYSNSGYLPETYRGFAAFDLGGCDNCGAWVDEDNALLGPHCAMCGFCHDWGLFYPECGHRLLGSPDHDFAHNELERT
ncbi:hypothetical protein [Nocardia sp. NPDC057227]|uniref:hypothetical protein n=1 Tax=Nocardia sp. NPDC057227 TaxID=3346056 RepID=UPI003637ACD8